MMNNDFGSDKNKLIRVSILVAVLAVVGALVGYFVLGGQKSGSDPAAPLSASQAQNTSQKISDQTGAGELWTKRCAEAAEGQQKGQCEVFQRLIHTETQQRVLEIAVTYNDETRQTARAAIILPLGLNLPAGGKFSVDEKNEKPFPVQSCDPGGCIAVVELTASDVLRMKMGQEVIIGFVDNRGQPYDVRVSLKGFKEGYESL
jgi:invasion protein IalB